MSYNKTLVSSKQKTMLKSITDLLSVLSEIEIGDASGNNGEIVLDDGSVMTLSLATDKGRNNLYIERISVTNARLNLDVVISRAMQNVFSQDKAIIRLVKKKPNKIRLVLKKQK